MRAKRAFAGFLAAVLVCLAASAGFPQEDIERHRECTYCGMDRKGYGYSRVLIRYQDGSETGVCSIRCALVDIGANPGKTVQSYRVADRDTRELLDAETAVWVMGGRKRGVMTPVPKWAFGSTPAAESFVREYGGQVVPWTAVLDAARKELERKSR